MLTWMDLEIIILSEVSQTERDKYHMILLICGILKNDTNELTKQKETHSHRKQTYGYQRGKGGGERDTGREPGVKGSLIIFLGWEMLWGYADGGGMIT